MEIMSRKKPVIRMEGTQSAVFSAIKRLAQDAPGKTAKQLFEELRRN